MGYTHGIRWTDEAIKEKVIEVKTMLGIDRMPSRKECMEYFNDNALVSVVSRRMGWYKLAQELGLSIKPTETALGKRIEEHAMTQIEGIGFCVVRMPQNFPYDLLVNGCVKVDIKASRLYKGELGNFYSFNLEKPYATCDLYVLYTLDEQNIPKEAYVIPSKFVFANTQISIGEKNSKYHIYREKWMYLKRISDFFGSLQKE